MPRSKHFKTQANFDTMLASGNISDADLCFIKDTGQIWTHGKFYSGGGGSSDIAQETKEVVTITITNDDEEHSYILDSVIITLTNNSTNEVFEYPVDNRQITLYVTSPDNYTISVNDIARHIRPKDVSYTARVCGKRNISMQYEYIRDVLDIPNIGSFAYSDGMFSDKWFLDKTCIGLVFQVKRIDNKAIASVVSLEGVPLNLNGKIYPSILWGLCDDVSEAIRADIATALGVADAKIIEGVKVYKEAVGIGKDVTLEAIDESKEDGWVVIAADNNAYNNTEGKRYTQCIINHANKIIERYLNKPLPTSISELEAAITEVCGNNVSNEVLSELYYPQAYGCYLYEPNVPNLADCYKKTNWYLRTYRDNIRLWTFLYNSRGRNREKIIKTEYADESKTIKESAIPIYANALLRIERAGGDPSTFKHEGCNSDYNYSITSCEPFNWGGWRGDYNEALIINRTFGNAQNRKMPWCVIWPVCDVEI